METKIFSKQGRPDNALTFVCENAHLVTTPEQGLLSFDDVAPLPKHILERVLPMGNYVGKRGDFKCWMVVVRKHANVKEYAIDYVSKKPYYWSPMTWADVVKDEITPSADTLGELYEGIHDFAQDCLPRHIFRAIVKGVKNAYDYSNDKEGLFCDVARECINYAEEAERPRVEAYLQELKREYNLEEITEPYWNLEKKLWWWKPILKH